MTIEHQLPDIDWDDDGQADFLPATNLNKPDYDPVDVSSKAFWSQLLEDQDRSFAILRRERPVSWQRPVEDAVTPDPDDPGFWALTRLEDIQRVSRDNETFISGQGVLFDMLPPIFLEMSQSFLAMDDPEHAKLRRLVSSAFTPRQVRRMEDKIREITTQCVDDIVGRGKIDFPAEFSSRFPLRVHCAIWGVPDHLAEETGAAARDVVAWADPDLLAGRDPQEVQVEACARLHDIAAEMISERRQNRRDDLMQALMDAEIDGEQLDEAQIGAFFVLMSVAGTDTTQHTTTFAVMGLTEFPEQKKWLLEDFDNRIDGAVEEFIRFGTPVMTFRRTAVRETEIAGQRIMPGDKVVFLYASGNRDDTLIDRPWELDLSRDPNPHCGFGGGGVHYCLGSQLAKMMLRHALKELLFRIPEFQISNPRFMGTNFMRAVTHLDFEFTPERKET
ncbi:cytochrome P450 [Sporichthya polymorpha]|uniref:cytochrome P450 n=1 Tax=Sporichthya polymorpha TaxID=35751 RepID=UPI000360104F|nr:cytochrome P450 [Sporichthya polymorpha]